MGIVGRIKQLALAQVGAGPVAGAGFLRFLQFLPEKMRDGHFCAHRAAMPGAAQLFSKIEQPVRRDVQSGFQHTAVVAETEADFQDSVRFEDFLQCPDVAGPRNREQVSMGIGSELN